MYKNSRSLFVTGCFLTIRRDGKDDLRLLEAIMQQHRTFQYAGIK